MTWNTATQLSYLKTVGRETLVINGHKILMIWHDEQVFAVQAQCPHLKFPLKKGTIDEHCHLTCPLHKSSFDLKTGAVQCWSVSPPVLGSLLGKLAKPKSLRVYPTRLDGDDIEVELPAA